MGWLKVRMIGAKFPSMASPAFSLAVVILVHVLVPCSAQCDRDLKECPSTSALVERDPALDCAFPPCPQADPYLLYAWRNGYHPENTYTSGLSSTLCGDSLHGNPATGSSAKPECWEHNWEGWAARADLWAATTRPDRTVGLLLVGSVRSRLEDLEEAGWPRNTAGRCDDELFWLLRTNHCHGTRVYGLFADSDADFSERDRIPLVGWYNGNCSDGVASNTFDGVAVNNEHFSSVRCDFQEGAGDGELTWLDQLHDAVQLANPLPLHVSAGWAWSRCTNSTDGSYFANELPWAPPSSAGPHVTKPALQHMYDMASSVDVQVAHTNPASILARLDWADYSYHQAMWPSKDMYALAYTNPPPGTSPAAPAVCVSSHHYVYPPVSPLCGNPSGEIGMFAAFEVVELDRPHARAGVHSLRKSYGAGLRPDWPAIPFSSSLAYIKCILLGVTLADAEKKMIDAAGYGGSGAGVMRRIGRMRAALRGARGAVIKAERLASKIRDDGQQHTFDSPRERAADSETKKSNAAVVSKNIYKASFESQNSPADIEGEDDQNSRKLCLFLRMAQRHLHSLHKTLIRLRAWDGPAISEALDRKQGVQRLLKDRCNGGGHMM